jgi:hypothetical protein
MSCGMTGQPDSVGRQLSIWIRNDLIDKLERMAKARGVKRNRMLSQIVSEADEDA